MFYFTSNLPLNWEVFRREATCKSLERTKEEDARCAALLFSSVAAAADDDDDDDDDDECKRTGREISFASISSSVSETKNNEEAIVFLAVKDARKKGRRKEGLFVSVRIILRQQTLVQQQGQQQRHM